jgi:sortase B
LTDGTDEPLDPYDPAYINRSIFGSKMKGHRQTWPDIDLGELKAINPDCVGWVHMDRSPIDYPVVLGRFDPTYNLTYNFSGEESVHGQVYLDFRHGGRPSGRTCVLHAHHMKDWSMFKAIVSLEDPEYLAAHPAVELIHGDAHCIARWFAGVNYRSGDPWPERTRFADDADFDAWLSRVMAENIVPSDVRPAGGARLLVCCTCSYDYPPCDAFAALAVIENEPQNEKGKVPA